MFNNNSYIKNNSNTKLKTSILFSKVSENAKRCNLLVRMIIPMFLVLLMSSTNAFSSGWVEVNVIKAPVCGCDGEVELIFHDCGRFGVITTPWVILVSNTNQLDLSISEPSPRWNEVSGFSSYLHSQGSSTEFQTHVTIHNLCAGDWYFRFGWSDIQTAQGPTYVWAGAYGNATIAAHVNLQPSVPPLNCDVIISHGHCTDMKATPIVTGGTEPTTKVFVKLPSRTPADPNNLGTGTYEMTVTDANGCKCIKEFTLTAPDPLECDVTLMSNGCYYKSATGTATGGSPNYIFYFKKKSDGSYVDKDHLVTGTYIMTAIDKYGCFCYKEFDVTTMPIPQVSLKVTPKGCNSATVGGGCVEVSGSGTTDKRIKWKKTLPTASNGPDGVGENDWCGLQPGDKGTVEIIDVSPEGYGCFVELIWEIPPYTPITFSLLTKSYKEGSVCRGKVKVVELEGGEPPYTYTWANSTNTSDVLDQPLPFTFTCTVKDKNGCEFTQQVTMTCPTYVRDVIGHPNPWGGSVVVTYDVTATAHYAYKLYDANLTQVRSVDLGTLTADTYTTTIDGTGLLAGPYYFSIEQDGTPDPSVTLLIKE